MPARGQDQVNGCPSVCVIIARFCALVDALYFSGVGYFGAPTRDSANKWLSFQNDEKHVCPGQ